MKIKNAPPPTYAFAYKHPPRSGNVINGLGETGKRQARHIFHSAGLEVLEWQALDDFFSFINHWGVFRHVLGNIWQLRREDGPLNPLRVEVDDPAQMAERIKAEAIRYGAGIVGITRIPDEAVYEGYTVDYEYAIVIGLPMKREEMEHVPHQRAAVEVMRAYKEIARVAIELAGHIRQMGWRAKAYGNPNSLEILQIPLALSAGLGQLGKHGSMITKEYGSNFRLAAVLTDLPMTTDSPVDIGVEDLCASCTRCVKNCPPDAIFNEKQMVRGEEKWYVDFDKCAPYFTKTYGCGICIEVCPWSEPDKGHWLSEMLLARRDQSS